MFAILVKAGFKRSGIPALIGYMGLGFTLRLAGTAWGLLRELTLGDWAGAEAV